MMPFSQEEASLEVGAIPGGIEKFVPQTGAGMTPYSTAASGSLPQNATFGVVLL
jgi:hypothetical protein